MFKRLFTICFSISLFMIGLFIIKPITAKADVVSGQYYSAGSNMLSTGDSTFPNGLGDWTAADWVGADQPAPTATIVHDSSIPDNYVKLTNSDGQAVDRGLSMFVNDAQANTEYRLQAKIRVPNSVDNQSGVYGMIRVTDAAQSTYIQIDGPEPQLASGTWQTISMDFNSGSFSSLMLRMESYGFTEVDLTDIELLPLSAYNFTVSASAPATWGKTNTITTSITDTGSSVTERKWAAGDQPASYFTSNGTTFTGSFSVSADGEYTVYAADAAGNSVVQTVTASYVDTSPPTGGTSISPTTVTSGNVAITCTAADTQSGVASITTPDGIVHSGSTATYIVTADSNYTFVLNDNVGNTANISATVSNIVRSISVTHPITATYSINPNSATAFTAPAIPITNNSSIPIKVSVNSFSAISGGSIELHDVPPTQFPNWSAITAAQTQADIALGINVAETSPGSGTWSSISATSPVYVVNLSDTLMGVLNPGGTGNLSLSAKCGLAWLSSQTEKRNLILEFDITGQ
jgi:hypothetical protein